MLPPGHPSLVDVPADTYFWSSTELVINSSYAWSKPLLANVISAKSKDITQVYICVRGAAVAGG